jgi:hypothetical protein
LQGVTHKIFPSEVPILVTATVNVLVLTVIWFSIL